MNYRVITITSSAIVVWVCVPGVPIPISLLSFTLSLFSSLKSHLEGSPVGMSLLQQYLSILITFSFWGFLSPAFREFCSLHILVSLPVPQPIWFLSVTPAFSVFRNSRFSTRSIIVSLQGISSPFHFRLCHPLLLAFCHCHRFHSVFITGRTLDLYRFSFRFAPYSM